MRSTEIRFEDELDIAAEVGRVWEHLSNPVVVAECMPGAQLSGIEPDGTVRGQIRMKLGPTIAAFAGTIEPTFDEVQHEGRLVAQGADKGGRTRARATIRFRVDPRGERCSVLGLATDITVSGGLAPFAETGGVRLAKQVLDEFGETFTRRCQQGGGETAGEPVESEPISGAGIIVGIASGFAARVAGGFKRSYLKIKRALARVIGRR